MACPDRARRVTEYMTVSEYRVAIDSEIKTCKRRRKNADQKKLFLEAWREYGDSSFGDPLPEYKFAHGIIFYRGKDGRIKTRRWSADWTWRDRWLMVEVDGAPRMVKYGKNGRPYAVGGHDGESDHLKENTAAALGWRVMHFSPKELRKDPAGCVELVRNALEVK